MALVPAPLRSLSANGRRALRRLGAGRVLPSDTANWLLLRVGADLAEERPALAIGNASPLALVDVLRTLEVARLDERVAGVVVRLHAGLSGWGRGEYPDRPKLGYTQNQRRGTDPAQH